MAARKQKTQGNKNWIALDAGGTLTDAVIVDAKGQFLVGKHLTNKQDESVSFIGAIRDVAVAECRIEIAVVGRGAVSNRADEADRFVLLIR